MKAEQELEKERPKEPKRPRRERAVQSEPPEPPEAPEVVDEAEAVRVMTFPKELPMVFKYKKDRFYVRECYPVYYGEIIRLLHEEDKDVVTVSGTPGIGKSVFYAYFLLRYAKRYPGSTVVTASFKRQEMKKVTVWKNGEAPETKSTSNTTDSDMAKFVIDANNAAGIQVIHLYDGPPKAAPEDIKMVCFTSPNEAWFKSPENKKDKTNHAKIFMPMWDLEELQDAAMTLELKMPNAVDKSGKSVCVGDQIAERFNIFGGVARACLETDAQAVAETEKDINSAIMAINDFSKVKNLLGHVEGESTRHILCHFEPTESMRDYTIVPLNLYVERRLVERLSAIVDDNRAHLVDCFRDCSDAASPRGILFETGIHKLLSFGCTITARDLRNGGVRNFKLERSEPEKFDSDFDETILSGEGAYHAPTAKNFVSIDSFYYPILEGPDNQRWLLLFQMTVSLTHPVKGDGLAYLLKRLKLLTATHETSVSVALVFVVPMENAPKFKRQNIALYTSNDADVLSKLPLIGKTRERDLNEKGIKSIGELRSFLQEADRNGLPPEQKVAGSLTLQWLRSILARHDEKGTEDDRRELKKTLDAIPQFVWGTDLMSLTETRS